MSTVVAFVNQTLKTLDKCAGVSNRSTDSSSIFYSNYDTETVTQIMIMFEQLAFLPTWLLMVWLGACILFSPFAIFFVVCLPQLPLLVVRRACHIPFEYI